MMQENVTICCSSPERFLKLDRQGVLEAKPIKGTAARVLDDPLQDAAAAQQLAASEKDRAENLMIVDLLRNDLGRICEPCSVHVPGLMEVRPETVNPAALSRTFNQYATLPHKHIPLTQHVCTTWFVVLWTYC